MLIDEGVYMIVPFHEVEVNWNSRVRKEYNNIDMLAENIAQMGLINPITVYAPECKPPFILMAGGRRFKALTMLKVDTVPVRVYNRQLSPLELRAIELYENSQRSALPFNEEVNLIREINDAFQALYGVKTPGKKNTSGHGIEDTAKILKHSIGKVSTAIKLAKAMEEIPELQLHRAKNQAAALLKLQRFENITKAQIAAVSSTSTQSASRGYIVGDFFDNQLEDKSFQFLEVDPPYAIDIVENKSGLDKQLSKDNYEEIPADKYPAFIERLAKECNRLAADNSWIVFWFAHQWYELIKTSLQKENFIISEYPGVWKKGNSTGQCFNPHVNLTSSVEFFLWGRKGSAQLRKQGRVNLFDFNPIPPQQKATMHPTARPFELIKELIQTFCWPGYRILTPFAGSGNTIIAAHEMGHQCVGFDKSVEFHASFLNRWNERIKK